MGQRPFANERVRQALLKDFNEAFNVLWAESMRSSMVARHACGRELCAVTSHT